MATVWDTVMWIFGGGRYGGAHGDGAGPLAIPQQQLQQQPPIQLGGDGDNGNYAIFLYQQIHNAAPQMKEIMSCMFLVQMAILFLILAWIVVKRFTVGIATLSGHIKKQFWDRFWNNKRDNEPVRDSQTIRPRERRGPWIHPDNSRELNNRPGQLIWENENRATPPPDYSSIDFQRDVTTAITASILGAHAPQSSVAARTSEEKASNTVVNRITLPPSITPELFTKKMDVRKWLIKFDNFVNNQGVDDKVGTLRLFLDAECAELMGMAIPHGLDYESAKRIMIEIYGRDGKTVSELEHQFERAEQGLEESNHLFFIRLVNLARRAFVDRTEEAIREKIICRFVRGLINPQVKHQLMMENINDIQTLLERAKQMDVSLKRFGDGKQEKPEPNTRENEARISSTQIRASNTQACYRCGQNGHIARLCPTAPTPSAPPASVVVQPLGNQQQQQSLYSSGININTGGPALNNRATTAAATVLNNGGRNQGSNNTITAIDKDMGPEVEERRLIGKCKINDKLFTCVLDTGCDLTTIGARVAIETDAELVEWTYRPQLADGHNLELEQARVKLTLNRKVSNIIVPILPSLPVDVLIGLDVISQHPTFKPIYDKLKAQLGNSQESEIGEGANVEAGPGVELQSTGQIQMIQQQKHEVLEKLLEDGSKPETVRAIIETDEQEPRPKIPTIVNLEPKEIVDGLMTTREIEEVLYRVDIMNNYNERDLNVVRYFLDNLVKDISAKSYKDLTPTRVIEHVIRVTSEIPKKQKFRPVPQAKREEFKQIIMELRDAGFIEPSQSCWRHNARIVIKPDGSIRPAFDFRDINSVTIPDAFMLPNIQIIFTRMARSKWHSKTDFCNGYFQIWIEKQSRPYTAIITEWGLFQWCVMAMGLKNSAATYQRLMNYVFADYMEKFVECYVDDLDINSETLRLHILHVVLVFKRIAEQGLWVKQSKCEWVKEEIRFLGHTISKGVIKPSQQNIDKLLSFGVPKDKKTCRAFVGLAAYYECFQKDFAVIAAPLHKAGAKNAKKFIWTPECQQSYERLREEIKGKFLKVIDPNKDILIDTDASAKGIGGVMGQEHDGKEFPCRNYSKALSEAQQKYPAIERELMAIVKSLQHFRYYIIGRKVIVRVDHKPLKYLTTMKDMSQRLYNWWLDLENFHAEIVYRPGKSHINADALSRLISTRYEEQDDEPERPVNLVLFLWKSEKNSSILLIMNEFSQAILGDQQKDENIEWIKAVIEVHGEIPPKEIKAKGQEQAEYIRKYNSLKVKENLLFYTPVDNLGRIMERYVVPNYARDKVMEKLHKSVFSGHMGVNKTIGRAYERVWWPFCRSAIEKFIRECEECQKIKRGLRFNPPMQPIEVKRPMQLICTDDAGPLPRTRKGNIYIQIVVDHFTKLLGLYAKSENTAKTGAKIIMGYMMIYGLAEQVLSDQGASFESELLAELMDLLDIRKVRTSAFHPQTDGISEKAVGTIKQMISAYVSAQQDDWDKHLEQLCYAYNTSVHEATKMTPMEAMFNRKIKIPLDIFYKAVEITDEEARRIKDMDMSFTVGSYAYQVRDELQGIYELISKNKSIKMDRARINHERKVRAANFKVGEYVLVLDQQPPKKGRNASISKKWTGPWLIEYIYNGVDYALKSFHTKRVLYKTVHQCLLKKWHGPAFQHAKFKTTKHRERESKAGREILNTQDSNANTQVEVQVGNGKAQNQQMDFTTHMMQNKSQTKRKTDNKQVKRLEKAAITHDVQAIKQAVRTGRVRRRPDFFQAQ